MRAFTFVRLLYKRFFSETERDYAGAQLLRRSGALWAPKMVIGEYGKIWTEDRDFFEYYRKFEEDNDASAERKFFLRSLLSLVEDVPGDTAECGAYRGASSWLICDRFSNSDKTHYIFDSFQGLSAPSPVDGNYWKQGDLTAGEEILKKNLSGVPRVKILGGWIPERFNEVAGRRFCFVHIDVDLYQPTLDSIAFFYPRLAPGGIILSDDYGFSTCPGARLAIDEYMKNRPEPVVHVPTGQAFIIKRGL